MTKYHPQRSVSPILILFALCSCSGVIKPKSESDPDSDNETDPKKDGSDKEAPSEKPPLIPGTSERLDVAAPARVRRLNANEIRNSLADVLLGGSSTFSVSLPRDNVRHGFDTQFDRLSVPVEFADPMQEVAESAAALAMARPEILGVCQGAFKSDQACVKEIINRYGLSLYRRPVTPEDQSHLLELYDEVRKTNDHTTALTSVFEGMIQSPHFLFKTELGPKGSSNKLVRLTPFEIASYLSYSLLASAPDAELLKAAGDNELQTDEQVRKQAERLLKLPRAQAAFQRFYEQWIELGDPSLLVKADPDSTPAMSQAIRAEALAFWNEVVWNGDGQLKTLLRSTKSTVNADLAKLYGLSNVKAGASSAPVELDSKTRSGFLTQPGFIASHTSGAGTNPVYMGFFVRRKLFCQVLSAPANVPQLPSDAGLTPRERFAEHANNPGCKGCHELMDPIGFAFEEYTVMGRHKDDPGLTGAGELTGTDVDGKFEGPVALARKLEQSNSVKECFVSQMLEYLQGRVLSDPSQRNEADVSTLRALASSAGASTDNIKALLVSAVSSAPFLFRDRSDLPKGAN